VSSRWWGLAGQEYYDHLVGVMFDIRRNPQAYLLLDDPSTRLAEQRKEVEMFIFHDVVDLFALFGLVHLGRVISKRRHKVS